MHVEALILVRAPLEKTYAAYTDFESWPKWSQQTTEVKVIEREGGVVKIKSTSASRDRRRVSTANLVLTPPEKVESVSRERVTRKRRTVTFEGTSEGTKVTAVLDVQVNGLWRAIFAPTGREEAESFAQEGLKSFAKYVESLP